MASPTAISSLSELTISLPSLEGNTSELDFTSPIVIEILADGLASGAKKGSTA
ncbi:hypothetical protein CPB83DRAFT_886010, partial [Crepidotus variabilis]